MRPAQCFVFYSSATDIKAVMFPGAFRYDAPPHTSLDSPLSRMRLGLGPTSCRGNFVLSKCQVLSLPSSTSRLSWAYDRKSTFTTYRLLGKTFQKCFSGFHTGNAIPYFENEKSVSSFVMRRCAYSNIPLNSLASTV